MTLEDLLKEVEELDAKATKVEDWVTDTASDLERKLCYAMGPNHSFVAGPGPNPVKLAFVDQKFITRARTLLPMLGKVCSYLYSELKCISIESDWPALEAVARKEIESILSEVPHV